MYGRCCPPFQWDLSRAKKQRMVQPLPEAITPTILTPSCRAVHALEFGRRLPVTRRVAENTIPVLSTDVCSTFYSWRNSSNWGASRCPWVYALGWKEDTKIWNRLNLRIGGNTTVSVSLSFCLQADIREPGRCFKAFPRSGHSSNKLYLERLNENHADKR